jgi:nucleotide-binding universal stress UspA family protein
MRYVVAFASPKRSAKTVALAAQQAKALDAELILLRVIPDPGKVGIVAQLISTDQPQDKAQQQIDEVVAQLKQQGVKASGTVRIGEVARSLVKITAEELKADILFVGTTGVSGRSMFLMQNDPIVHYLVDNCPVSICLVRHDPGDALEEPADS